MLLTAADLLMVSALGNTAVAAVSIFSQPRMVILCVTRSYSVALSAYVARRRGKHPDESLTSCSRASLMLGCLSHPGESGALRSGYCPSRHLGGAWRYQKRACVQCARQRSQCRVQCAADLRSGPIPAIGSFRRWAGNCYRCWRHAGLYAGAFLTAAASGHSAGQRGLAAGTGIPLLPGPPCHGHIPGAGSGTVWDVHIFTPGSRPGHSGAKRPQHLWEPVRHLL